MIYFQNKANNLKNDDNTTDVNTMRISIKNTYSLSDNNQEISLEKQTTDNRTVSLSLEKPRSRKNKRLHSTIVPENSNSNNDQSDYDIFGMSVASQLKKLSEEQAVLARDKIQNILTRCRLTNLRSKNSNCTKSSSYSQCQFINSWPVPKQESTHTITSNSLLEPCCWNGDTLTSAEYEDKVEMVYSEESN